MAKINLLTADVYNRIAAGEVVDRPYSVVKELVENAIDAGAKEIVIEVEQGGKKLIRVTDDGSGISKDDLKSAYLPHATSKLKTAEDLERVLTLGFRGEAVASIASVSRMKIVSKTADADAFALSCTGGVLGEIVPEGGANGTCVTVEDLFFNTPARLKFLKSDSAEEGDIANMVSRFILSRPEICFTYYTNGKVKYRSFGDGLTAALAVVYGTDAPGNCYEIRAEKHGVSLRGFIGDQNYSKPNRSYQSLFVNGRYVVNQTVSAAITNAYAAYLMKRQYPFYVLFLDVPSEIVDVNVHPNKADVRFADNQVIYGCVYSIVSSVLDGNSRALEYIVPDRLSSEAEEKPQAGNAETSPAASFADTSPVGREASLPDGPAVKGAASSEKAFGDPAGMAGQRSPRAAEPSRAPSYSPAQGAFSSRSAGKRSEEMGRPAVSDREMTVEEAKKQLEFEIPVTGGRSPAPRPSAYPVGEDAPNVMEVRRSASAEKEDAFEENKRYLEELARKAKQERVDVASAVFKGELFHTYLIYEAGDDAYLIDQHAAHERLIYDRLKRKCEAREVASQPMLVPYVFTVNALENSFLERNLENIRSLGFEIEEFGGMSYKVSAVPLDLQGIRLEEFFGEILSQAESLRAIRLDELLKDKLATAACKAAVKGGESLTADEVRSLMEQMQGNMGLRCPHGRPVAVRLTRTEIEKMFKRIV